MATTNPDPVVNNNTKHRTFSTSAPHEQHTYNKEASAYDKTRRTGLGPNASGDVPGNNLYPDAHVQDMLEMQGDNNTAFGDKSPGVRRIEAIGSCFTSWHRWVLFTFIFLVACKYTLFCHRHWTALIRQTLTGELHVKPLRLVFLSVFVVACC